MMWCDAFDNPSMITARFQQVPDLTDISVWDFQVIPDSQPYLQLSTHLPTLPDQPNLPEGRVPEKSDVGMVFIGLRSFIMNGTPTTRPGILTVSRQQHDRVAFAYASPDFEFGGECDRASIIYVNVLTTFDSQRFEPRGPRLFSHPNVWNTCLLLIRDYGYTITVKGHSAHRGYLSRYQWSATINGGAKLSADNPIELLGLVAIHRHHGTTVDAPYWWRIDGPPLMADLLNAYDKLSDPRNIVGQTD